MTTLEELEERIKALEAKHTKLVGFTDATVIRNKLYHLGNQAQLANLLYINPEYNSRIGFGTSSPDKPLHILQTAVTPRIRLEHTNTHYVDIGITEGASDESIMFIEPHAPDGDENAIVRLFRETNTTGTSELQILMGNNSATAMCAIGNKNSFVLRELGADPDDPPEGCWCIWMSDGNGTGDDGDLYIKITAGGATKTHQLADFSEIAA